DAWSIELVELPMKIDNNINITITVITTVTIETPLVSLHLFFHLLIFFRDKGTGLLSFFSNRPFDGRPPWTIFTKKGRPS
ncbi:MAG: hypothetical protein IJX99_01140, partial [Clostridia bacterium]|nr:hypothetical protein [Clostridia bacterium]